MNVDRRGLGTSRVRVVRVRILGPVAAMVLLIAGCLLLGEDFRSSHLTALAKAARTSQNSAPAPASFQSDEFTPPANTGAAAQTRARSVLAGLPLMFEPNQGQANLNPNDSRAKFIARGSGYSLLLGSEGAILNLSSRVPAPAASKSKTETRARVESLRMKLAGSNPAAVVSASEALSSTANYILGNDPAKWRHNVPQFGRVNYENVYPGINLAFYGNQGHLEYDFQVAPGANPARAELEFDGAKRLQLRDGALVIEAQGGAVRLDAPRVYQQIDGRQHPVEGSFVLRAGNRAGFAIGPYDHSRELIIDPILTYSTYFGGSTGDEHFSQIAVDSAGNIYLAGSTTSTNLPTVSGVYQTTLNGTQNVYIAKINPTQGANGLVYVTYLGGSGTDYPVGVAVDGGGNVYVAGTTTSANFPTTPTTAYQTVPEPGTIGAQHAFVTELNSVNGVATALQYSTYLSGNGNDIASGMTIDARGFVYVTGTTTSSDTASTTDQFPASTVPQGLPFQNFPRGPIQFFVTKVNTTAPKIGSINYSTYFGGGTTATGTTPTVCPAALTAGVCAVGGGITVDVNGNIYFSGTTNYTYSGTSGTTDFPILSAYQPCLDTPPPTIVINPPVCTSTATTANTDAFVAKLNPNALQGEQLQWSTYVGGSGSDSSTGVAVDPVGATNVYITGTTNSPDVTTLTTFAGYQVCLDTPVNPPSGTACPTISASPVPTDAFVARLTNPATASSTTNMSLTYFSYLGGSANDDGLALTVDSANGALMTGWTQSSDFPVFPTPNAVQSQLNGPQNAFVARLNTAATLTNTASWSNPFGGNNTDQGTSITLDTNQNVYVAGDTNSSSLLQLNKPYEGYQGGFDAFVTELGPAGGLSISGSLTLGTNQVYVSAGNQATFSYVLTNQGPDLLSNITVSDDISPTNTGVTLAYVSASVTSGTCSGGSTTTVVSCLIPSLQAFSTATVTVVLTPTPNSDGGTAQFNGGTVTANSPNNVTPATVTVNAKMSDFTLSVSPTSVSVPVAGDTATYQVLLTPNPVYGTNIGLSCTGLPAGSTCAFSATSVSLPTSSPASPTLNITTTARPITLPSSALFTRHFYALWLPFPGLALLGVGLGGSRSRRRIVGMLMLCAVFGLILLQPACSGTSTQPPVSGTPAGTYTVTVAATSGSDTKTFPIQLTVP